MGAAEVPSRGQGVGMMKRVTGLRTLGAGVMLTALTATGVLVTPGVGGAASTSSAKFGTLPSPCGKGHDTGATDKGVCFIGFAEPDQSFGGPGQ